VGLKREDAKLLFNARAEGITDVNFWKKSFSLRRCIVSADSFFVWQKSQQGKKPKFETMAPVHNRQPAILAPRDYQEYLENAERPPIHLLRVFPDDEVRAEEIDQGPISNEQASLFDSQ
jgi:putative SOS response-associated peptidase YedK